MPSRKYISYKFLYDDDRGRQSIKRHRSYLNSDGLTEDTPTTALFLARVVNMSEKVTGTSAGLRHVLAYVGTRELIAKIPYRPSDPLLIEHVQEILAQPQVICGEYNGERLSAYVYTNSI
ncbi:MAG: hypothetical protein KME09_14740 [Pleurocapsa minor HA4230-MV1]|jgi:hypothetical protein|nr:hypothetical protein [Pleurocapsa minor HA4230-MV1]